MSYKEESLNKNQLITITFEGRKKILYQMENCICKIYKEDDTTGAGFFCKIPYENKLLPVLVTNYNILNEKDIENDIKISINDKIKIIEKDNSRKRIAIKKLDVTFIEIKPNKDHIENKNYFELDLKYLEKEKELLESEYNKKSVYILHYLKGELSVSYSLINDIIDEKIDYYCNNKEDLLGCPILSLKNNKIIGIHNGYYTNSHIKKNYGTFIKYAINEFNNNIKEYKNEINLKYIGKGYRAKLFGIKFAWNNRNNFELEINGIKKELINDYELKRGENNIKIIIKNKLTNLEDMFRECESLKNINELKYLDTKDINNFSYMFYGCESLSDIKALQNWKVSNGTNFKGIFIGCKSLKDITPL